MRLSRCARSIMRFLCAGLLLGNSLDASADILTTRNFELLGDCTSPHALGVIRGEQVPELLGSRIDSIRLYRSDGVQLQGVPVQFDRKDELNRYLIEEDTPDHPALLDSNDEIVFLRADAGTRLQDDASTPALIELELAGAAGAQPLWLYARTGVLAHNEGFDHQVRYYPELRSVRSALYTIGFSARHPFLIDSLSLKLPGQDDWSLDITDTMKIRHQGTFLGWFDFRRTQDDYDSHLVAVKNGPLRIILRTENQVRIWWKLETPSLYIDYIMMPDGFVMDSVIDIPFNIGLFMSDVETLTTVDWNQNPDLPPLFIDSPYTRTPLLVDGSMSADKQFFDGTPGVRFSVSNAWGTLDTRLEIAEDFPIEASLYLRDHLSRPDPPEERIGQFGNVGFLTTGWENIDIEVHHLKFTVCVTQRQDNAIQSTSWKTP